MVGEKVRKASQASGQDVPAPQTGQVLPVNQNPWFKTYTQKAHTQCVRIRTSPSPLITQGWRWPPQRSGDCRSSSAHRKRRTWSGCCRGVCRTSLAPRQGSQLCLRTETRSVLMARRRCPPSFVNQKIKEWKGYLGNHLLLEQQERGRLMSSD